MKKRFDDGIGDGGKGWVGGCAAVLLALVIPVAWIVTEVARWIA